MSLSGTLRSLPPESRMTGGAALALIVTLLLPWYQVSYFQGGEAGNFPSYLEFDADTAHAQPMLLLQ